MSTLTIQQDKIFYELSKKDFTAEIINSPNACGDVFISKSIKYQSQEYKITGIKENSFKNNSKIESIKFSEDSSLRSIKKKSFSLCSIKTLFIPSNVEELEEGWCCNSSDLEKVILSSENKNFKYLDDKHQIILGKSDKNANIFDTIIFACRNIESVTIPKEIRYIKSYAFCDCEKLKTIEISKDSEMLSIGKKSFECTSIKSLFIPSNFECFGESWCHSAQDLTEVKISPENKNFKYLDNKHQIILGKSDKNTNIFDTIIFACRKIKYVVIPKEIKYIKSYAFGDCNKLKMIEISKDSEMLSFGKNLFKSSDIKNLYIPSNFKDFEDGWCKDTPKLFEVKISSENKNFKYLDEKHQIIVGKSDKNSDIFDTIIFACRNIKSVTIPKEIKYIKKSAFEDCHNLTTIEFSEDSELLFIGKDAFSYSELEEIKIPKTVYQIQKRAFAFCTKLKKAVFEKGSKLESFEYCLFEFCHQLEIIEIPNDSNIKTIKNSSIQSTKIDNFLILPSIEELEDNWCNGTPELVNVTISPENKNFKYLDEKHQIIVGKSDKNCDVFDTIIFACRNIKSVTIPKEIIYIKSHAFSDCNQLLTVNFSEDSEIKRIEKCVFSSSSIENLFIPKSVEEFDDEWCNGTSKLKNVTISPENKHIKYLDEFQEIIVSKSNKNESIFDTIIFANRNIKTAIIPKHIKCIKPRAFENCKFLSKIEISQNSELSQIGYNAFAYSSITKIIIPKNVSVIDNNAFYSCNELEKVVLEEGSKLQIIKSDLFSWCKNLTKLEIPENSSLKRIENDSFSYTSLKSIYIPSSVEELEDDWCCDTKKLSEVVISPDSQNFKYMDDKHKIVMCKSDKNSDEIDTIAFASRKTSKVMIPKEIKYIKSGSFDDCKNLKIFQLPKETRINSIDYGTFTFSKIQKIVVSSYIDEFENGWCSDTPKLNEVVIPPENKNFKYLDDKHQIIIGKSGINQEIFDTIIFASRNITSMPIIPKQIKYIKPNAFEECVKLTSITFSEDSELIKIGSYSFSYSHIKTIKIPKSVSIIKQNAFSNCKKLKKVVFEKGSKLLSFEKNLFYSCDELESIEIDDSSSLQNICDRAFCFSSIKNIYIPPNVEELKDGWLSSTFNLTEITISPKNKNFTKLNGQPKIIIGKSDKNSDIFDTIVFAMHDIEYAKIQKQIKYIKPYAFENCNKLKTIEISENSEIKRIEKCVFSSSSIENLFIPKSVEEFDDEWCNGTSKLKSVTISPENKHIKYLDEFQEIIVSKSNKNESIFDTIIFANRNIKTAIIPKHIKCIKPRAFENCKFLSKIEIPDDSEITKIGRDAFKSTSIVSFRSPRKICKYEHHFLNSCSNLHYFEYLGDSFLKDEYSNIFEDCKNLILLSFPNVKRLDIQKDNIKTNNKEQFRLYVSACTEIEFVSIQNIFSIISDSDDDTSEDYNSNDTDISDDYNSDDY